MAENKWDDEDDGPWGATLPDDPESVERRKETQRALRSTTERALRYAYMVIGILAIIVIVLVLTR